MELSIVENKRLARMVESGSTIDAIGGVAAVVLAVVGLADIASVNMVSIAAIVLGASLLFQGGLMAAEYNEILSHLEGGPYLEFGGGLGAEGLAGISAIILGVLALFGMDPTALMSVAAIVLGAGLVLSSGVAMRFNSVKIDISEGTAEAKSVAQGALTAASFTQIFVGVGAIILGVLAVIGINPMTLSLISMLSIGASGMLSGGAIFGKMWGMAGPRQAGR